MSDFSKNEVVYFNELLEGFEDMNIASNVVKKFYIPELEVARAQGSGVWRPMPYIARSFSGSNATGNFAQSTQLSVPAAVNTQRHSTIELNPNEAIDDLQLQRQISAAKEKLATDIEGDILTTLVNQGTRVIKRTVSATGFQDLQQAAGLFDNLGISGMGRKFFYNTDDYYNAAYDLSSRQNFDGLVQKAYTDGKVPQINQFDTYSVPRMPVITAAAATGVTVNGANQYYTPRGRDVTDVSNVDNRYQNLTITVTSGTVKVGDCFTIANVFDRSMVSKQILSTLKTFRITAIVSGAGGSGVVTISPPIISGGGSTQAELQYQNCSATPANGAAITFLNTVTRAACPFFQENAIEVLPGKVYMPDAGMGVAYMTATTPKSKIPVSMMKWIDGQTQVVRMRVDVRYGVVLTGPEHAGVVLFNQT